MVNPVLLVTGETNHECVMIKIEVSKEPVLRVGLIVKSYHVNMITEGAGLRARPTLGRLYAQELHGSVAPGLALPCVDSLASHFDSSLRPLGLNQRRKAHDVWGVRKVECITDAGAGPDGFFDIAIMITSAL